MFTSVTENVRRMNGAIQGETTFSSVQRSAGLRARKQMYHANVEALFMT